jgi:hypothetical protein
VHVAVVLGVPENPVTQVPWPSVSRKTNMPGRSLTLHETVLSWSAQLPGIAGITDICEAPPAGTVKEEGPALTIQLNAVREIWTSWPVAFWNVTSWRRGKSLRATATGESKQVAAATTHAPTTLA